MVTTYQARSLARSMRRGLWLFARMRAEEQSRLARHLRQDSPAREGQSERYFATLLGLALCQSQVSDRVVQTLSSLQFGIIDDLFAMSSCLTPPRREEGLI